MTALLKYDAACRAIAEAKSVDEVREWIDKAAAVREYTRRVHNRQLEIDAIEIRVRAKKRRGELLIQLKSEGTLRAGKPSSDDEGLSRITLEELGVTENESSEDQRIAQIEGDSFERLVARCRAYAEGHPEKHSFDVLKPPPEGPINGARSTMGSRQEPDDSLDYFPTPPWATRALAHHVMPIVGQAGKRLGVAWEPACGEGHIAEILAEYADEVIATDVFDYGYGTVQDFLQTDIKPPGVDWIVTNPPFGEVALDFVRRSLSMLDHGVVRVGVAMFFRSQWAVEGVERYDEIFRDRPPTVCAFFTERVNLCKGRWEPGGSTATAYCWLVWIRNDRAGPQRLKLPRMFWIPPHCRKELSKPDDAERFTAHPVIRKQSESPHDPITGEIQESESEAVKETV